ncbi:protein of unknown function [endosymbiont DhMRE of Dentiscutata heterogama]|uniref:hypothetical protein n=1 Tax=endosymbiont DhMRE of Dentiscutata heterogama TaxID=1609546 RepID=UPI000629D3F5|nr:hypothetical protein [endosymbiont DhMRE of Dentiscutata heterogama]CFW93385.1 protein of unknown function [endosymbiont DhMRE of Dentiscutata heterogama]
MARNYKKISELEAKVSEQQQEITRLKDTLATIGFLIRRGEEMDKQLFNIIPKDLTIEQQTEQLIERLDANGLQLIVPSQGNCKAVIVKKGTLGDDLNKQVLDKIIEESNKKATQKINKDIHADESKSGKVKDNTPPSPKKESVPSKENQTQTSLKESLKKNWIWP